MTRDQYLKELANFEQVLTALDLTNRLNGSDFTPSEIKNTRKNVHLLRCLIEVGAYDFWTIDRGGQND